MRTRRQRQREHAEGTHGEGADASLDDLLKDLGGSPWVEQWDEDEGANRSCARSAIEERHNATVQEVKWTISI